MQNKEDAVDYIVYLDNINDPESLLKISQTPPGELLTLRAFTGEPAEFLPFYIAHTPLTTTTLKINDCRLYDASTEQLKNIYNTAPR